MPTKTAPSTHHLDRRAANIAAQDVGADDDLLTTRELADWLSVSEQWVQIGRAGVRTALRTAWPKNHSLQTSQGARMAR